MSNIWQRIITGTIYITLIVFSSLIHPLIFGVLTIAFNYIAVIEFSSISGISINKRITKAAIATSLLILFSVIIIYLNADYNYIILSAIVLSIYFFVNALYQKEVNQVNTLPINLLIFIYITVPLILINLILSISGDTGIQYVLAMFFIIWTNDTFAYLFGISLGKHKMFERISPKKSWEGFFGGLLMVVVAAFILNYIYPSAGLIHWVLFSIITAIASVIGDFIESMFKRAYGVKDSGSILPGHGGILDRIDSLLLASPAIYIFLNFALK